MTPNTPPLISLQKRRIGFALAILAVSGVMQMCSGTLGSLLHVDGFVFTMVGTVVGLFCFVFAILSIRCPACRTSLFWRAVSEQLSNAWTYWLMNVKRCPKCGFEGAPHVHAKAD